jgi:hypothetical protein
MSTIVFPLLVHFSIFTRLLATARVVAIPVSIEGAALRQSSGVSDSIVKEADTVKLPANGGGASVEPEGGAGGDGGAGGAGGAGGDGPLPVPKLPRSLFPATEGKR